MESSRLQVLRSRVVQSGVVSVDIGALGVVELRVNSGDDPQDVVRAFAEEHLGSGGVFLGQRGEFLATLEHTVQELIASVNLAEAHFYRRMCLEQYRAGDRGTNSAPSNTKMKNRGQPSQRNSGKSWFEEKRDTAAAYLEDEEKYDESESTLHQAGNLLGAAQRQGAPSTHELSSSTPKIRSGETLLERRKGRQAQSLKVGSSPSQARPKEASYFQEEEEEEEEQHEEDDETMVGNGSENTQREKSQLDHQEHLRWTQAMSSPRRNNDPATFFS